MMLWTDICSCLWKTELHMVLGKNLGKVLGPLSHRQEGAWACLRGACPHSLNGKGQQPVSYWGTFSPTPIKLLEACSPREVYAYAYLTYSSTVCLSVCLFSFSCLLSWINVHTYCFVCIGDLFFYTKLPFSQRQTSCKFS